MIEKLVIGCANFGQPYNGHQVPAEEIDKIWDYCREAGIKYADTATAYNYEPPPDFKITTKIKINEEVARKPYYACLLHYNSYEDIDALWKPLWDYLLSQKDYGTFDTGYFRKIGLSIYGLHQLIGFDLRDIDIVQLPYAENKKLLPLLKRYGLEIHARKVFADNCYKEALLDPLVDKVVIGIDNLEQLKENVEIARKLEKEKICLKED